MAYLIHANEIADGWKSLIKKIMEEGAEIKDERGSLTRELLNVMVTIEKPLGKTSSSNFYLKNLEDKLAGIKNIKVPEGYFWSGEKLEKYSQQFTSSDQQGFIYTYGNRLRAHFKGIDQIQEAINRLKNCRESRRAISITWDPLLDTENEEVPCMILVDFKIRANKLFTTALWRSHDIYGAWFPNVVGLTYLAQYVAREVGTSLGSITIHSISAHIYEVNFDESNKL